MQKKSTFAKVAAAALAAVFAIALTSFATLAARACGRSKIRPESRSRLRCLRTALPRLIVLAKD